MAKAIVDVDGILWPYHLVLVKILAERHGVPEQIPSKWDWYKDFGVTDEQALDAFDEMHKRQIWAKPMDGAKELLRTCMDKYGQVIVASHRKPKFASRMAAWLIRNELTDFSALYAGHDKFMFFAEGDLVIDDAPRNIAKALKIGAVSITLAWPWNEGTKAVRFQSLQEMSKWIREEK